MSRLIFKGDTLRNFGQFLPAPFIERIYVDDDEISVDLSLYILVNEDQEDQEDLEERLENLKSYVYLQPYLSNQYEMLNEVFSHGIWETTKALEDPIESIINKEVNIIDYISFSLGDASEETIERIYAAIVEPAIASVVADHVSFLGGASWTFIAKRSSLKWFQPTKIGERREIYRSQR